MEAAGQIRHTANLPFGYRATFISVGRSGMRIEWEPDVPCIVEPRAWRKFRKAYTAARRSFWTDVATSIGGNVMIVDGDGVTEVIRPATKQ